MTQEQKELLLKDLCGRLPFGVRMKGVNEDFELSTSTSPERLSYVLNSADFKPYLRPMSSMTEEEREELEHVSDEYFGIALDKQIEELVSSSSKEGSRVLEYIASSVVVDWLNAHHFDYRGLIPKGLALEATEGMYNTNK